MFVVHEVMIDTRFEPAAARLADLVSQGTLHGPSEAAYEGGLDAVLRVGPFGDTRGVSKLVRVRYLDPLRRGDTMTVPLRWEATGVAGELFPVLDADLTLATGGDGRSRLSLTGTYRPPFGRTGAALDRVLLHRLATATVRRLLTDIAEALADTTAEAGSGTGGASRHQSPAEPGES